MIATPNPHKVTGEGSVSEVIRREKSLAIRQGDCVEYLDGLRAASGEPTVDLIIGSPQYADKHGRYADPAVKNLDVVAWVDWMLEVTTLARRACKGDVIWIVNGPVNGGFYGPACEGLLWRWFTERGPKLDDEPDGDRLPGRLERPCIWTKNAPPNRPDWFGNDFEYVLCFPRAAGPRVTWNWEAVGTPPKYTNGGRFNQRGTDGKRKPGGEYPKGDITRPRDVIRATVGGGHMGHPRAHDNEAPFPLSLVEVFIKALTNPGDIVCDPFLGSGTTCHASIIHGRGFVGCDIRDSQVQLTRERMGSVPGW